LTADGAAPHGGRDRIMTLELLSLGFAGLALLLLTLTLRALRRGRLLRAGGEGLLASLFAALAALSGAIGLNLHTYQRLTHEQPVAELAFTRISPGEYQLRLTRADGSVQLLGLSGDEWQLDARVLKWHGVGNLLGLDAQYRLERVRGRYRDLERERSGPHSVHDLAPEQGVDLWTLAQRHERWLPFVDAVYGSAAYLPMGDGARYKVRLSQAGLVARPAEPGRPGSP
jgi:hypothetical protein